MCTKRCTNLKPFLFSRGQNHYVRFFVPTSLRGHFGKKYLTFALGIGAGHELRLKAHQLEHHLTIECNRLLHNGSMRKSTKAKAYDLDVFFDDEYDITHFENIDDDEDLRRAKELLEFTISLKQQKTIKKVESQQGPKPQPVKGLKIVGLVDKFFLLKSQLKPSTAQSYKNSALEFQEFLKNPNITEIMVSDVSRFQEHLARKKNSTRTIDNKTGVLRLLFNFAIKHGHYFEKNPAEGRALLTKKQKISGGFESFELEEIELIFKSSEFKREKERDPDFFYLCALALVTGCRVGELASLHKSDFKQTAKGTTYIKLKEAKTLAGVRSVPFPQDSLDGFNEFLAGKTENVFKYVQREGKGAGNASGKKFTRLLETLKIKREKLVFHSLRKFLNDYLLKNDVQYEPRCQFIGHDIDDTNVASYTKQFTQDELKDYVNEHQSYLIACCELLKA